MIVLQAGKAPLAAAKGRQIQSSLCPTMDLIVLSCAGQSHVSVYRSIDWERLFVATCPSPSGALAWRPDGKEVAVGTEHGKIVILSSETGAERDNDGEIDRLLDQASIQCIAWTASPQARPESLVDSSDAGEYGSDDDDDSLTQAILNGLSSEAKTSKGNGELEGPDASRHVNIRCDAHLLGKPCLDVLIAGDDKGRISLHIFGSFLAGVVNLPVLAPTLGPVCIDRVFLSQDLDILVAACHTTARDQSSINVCTFDTSILDRARSQMSRIALEYAWIRYELKRLKAAVSQASRSWQDGVVGPIRKLFAPLIEEMECSMATTRWPSGDTGLIAVLVEILTRGVYDSTVTKFLQATSEAVLQKSSKAWSNAIESIIRSLENILCRGAEAILFRIGDLIGLVRVDPEFEKLGVKTSWLLNVQQEVQHFAMAIERARALAKEAHADLSCLDRWLLGLRRRWQGSQADPVRIQAAELALRATPSLSQKDMQRLINLLRPGSFQHRLLSSELGLKAKDTRVVPAAKAVMSWDRDAQDDENDEEADGDNIYSLGGASNGNLLCDRLDSVCLMWETLVSTVSEAISASFKLLVSFPFSEQVSSSHVENEIQLLAIGSSLGNNIEAVYPSGDNSLIILTFERSQKEWKSRVLDLELGTDENITHVVFCGATPGRNCGLEGSMLGFTTNQKRLQIIGRDDGDELVVVRDEILKLFKNEAIVALSCSGPRGTLCVFTSKRSFQLLDFVNLQEDEEEEQDVEMEEESKYGRAEEA